jgi:hypothetical protein
VAYVGGSGVVNLVSELYRLASNNSWQSGKKNTSIGPQVCADLPWISKDLKLIVVVVLVPLTQARWLTINSTKHTSCAKYTIHEQTVACNNNVHRFSEQYCWK